MKYCFRCGEELEKDDIFCFSCGTRQSMARNKVPLSTRPAAPPPRPPPPQREYRPRPPPVHLTRTPPAIRPSKVRNAPLHVYEKDAGAAVLLSLIIPGSGMLYVDSSKYFLRFLLVFCFFWLIIPYILGLVWSIDAVERYNRALYGDA
ncbi:MAG: zinc ribbon domain-containing protein [Promethearchaeota archaeon]